jgi:hypothetical protein
MGNIFKRVSFVNDPPLLPKANKIERSYGQEAAYNVSSVHDRFDIIKRRDHTNTLENLLGSTLPIVQRFRWLYVKPGAFVD